jgi:hypothetical protein
MGDHHDRREGPIVAYRVGCRLILEVEDPEIPFQLVENKDLNGRNRRHFVLM